MGFAKPGAGRNLLQTHVLQMRNDCPRQGKDVLMAEALIRPRNSPSMKIPIFLLFGTINWGQFQTADVEPA